MWLFFSHPGPQKVFCSIILIAIRAALKRFFESGQPIRDRSVLISTILQSAPSPMKQGPHAQFPLGQGSFSTLAGHGLLTLCTHYARFGCRPWTNHEANFLPSQAILAWIFRLSCRFDNLVVCFRSSHNWAHLHRHYKSLIPSFSWN